MLLLFALVLAADVKLKAYADVRLSEQSILRCDLLKLLYEDYKHKGLYEMLPEDERAREFVLMVREYAF